MDKVAGADKFETVLESKLALKWIWLPFQALSATQMYDLLALRQQIFVVEQACVFQDADGIDRDCWHGLGYMGDGQLGAYARIVPPGLVYSQASIGRVVIAPALRGVGAGHVLMEQAMAQVALLFPGHDIKIGAQAHLQRFYGRSGFETCGDVYDEDGIDHVHMIAPKA